MFQILLDLLFPPKCMLCSRIMESSEKAVCDQCLVSDLPELEGDPPQVQYFEKSAATFYYKEPITDAIIRFKFHGMASYSRQFAQWLAGTIRAKLDGRYDLISWVPCSKRRIWTRGFDQAELLAKAVAKELGMEAVQTLKKVKHNPKQSRTVDAAARRANVLGVYRPYQPERFRGKRILLIDDVLTTGATLSECGKVLRMAGSGDLCCAAIAAAHRNNE